MIKGHASKRSRSRGSGRRGPNKNTVFDSNGPDVRVRGTAQQIIDKYMSLARDAASSGDRVGAENFLQHADHYQRMLNEIAGARPEVQRPNRRQGNGSDNDNLSGDETDSEDKDTAADAEKPGNDGEEKVSKVVNA